MKGDCEWCNVCDTNHLQSGGHDISRSTFIDDILDCDDDLAYDR